MEHQFHCGKKFYQDKKTGYWISTTCPKIRAHVLIWKHYCGIIPKNCHIHHIDGNKSNNHISNLRLIHCASHMRLHMTPERRQKSKELCNRIRPLTKEWHRSKEGREWHREHGKKIWEKRESFKINCLFCGIEIETKTYHHKFCHQNCKAKYGRRILKSKKHNTSGI